MNLKRCPFCGGYALLLKSQTSVVKFRFYVRCIECGTSQVGRQMTKEEAIKLWNHRIKMKESK